MTIYQLKIEFAGSQPPIWRRIRVASNTSFSELDDIIQIAFQWEYEFEYEFTINKVRIFDFGPAVDSGSNPDLRDSMDTFLDDYLTLTKTKFDYTCHAEDLWRLNVILEEVSPDDENFSYPYCISGERAAPPDGCGGILAYQNMLQQNHPQHASLKDPSIFDIDEVNIQLRQYMDEWQDIYNETEATLNELENSEQDTDEEDYSEYINEEYEYLKQFKKPEHLLIDESHKNAMEEWLEEAFKDTQSVESIALKRLIDQGLNDSIAKKLILESLAIEWYYDLKYDAWDLEERYIHNLNQLPEPPMEIPNLNSAMQVLNYSQKGIPYKAIDYFHHDKSPAATSAIINALRNYSDHQYSWGDCIFAPLWYTLAAEGHICEELIDPVIDLCKNNNHESDWLLEQAEFLIGKLAQKFPNLTTERVLIAMEKDAEEGTEHIMFFLFDCFYFCDIDKYKERLISLLKYPEISWHEPLASTLSFLQVKEALPILKQQLADLVAKDESKNYIEYEEAIAQLEKGESLYPDVDMPICIRRDKSWKEEFEDLEADFYEESSGWFDENDEYSHDPIWPVEQGADRLSTTSQPIIKENKPGRNDPCPCGSGKKYKKCCIDKELN